MKRGVAIVCLALAACGDPVEPGGPELTANEMSIASATCERNAESQIGCLRTAFALDGCADLNPIGSMYKDSNEGFAHLTAFDASDACRAEISASAKRRGFVEQSAGEFARDFGEGYRELLTVSDDGTLQWEREQQ